MRSVLARTVRAVVRCLWLCFFQAESLQAELASAQQKAAAAQKALESANSQVSELEEQVKAHQQAVAQAEAKHEATQRAAKEDKAAKQAAESEHQDQVSSLSADLEKAIQEVSTGFGQCPEIIA